MSSYESEDEGLFNVVKKLRCAREQCRKEKIIHTIDLCTDTSTSGNYLPVVNTAKHNSVIIANSEPIDLCEDDRIFDEFIAKNSKPQLRRGRKKKEANTVNMEAVDRGSITNVPSRGRGRKRSRAAKNVVSDTINGAKPAARSRPKHKSTPSTSPETSFLEDFLRTTYEAVNGFAGTTPKRKRLNTRSRKSTNNTDPSLGANGLNLNPLNIPTYSPRGGRRGRGSRVRGRGRGTTSRNTTNFNTFPIYSVGNTDDYPDQSDDIPLFNKPTSTKTNTVETTDKNEETVTVDNELLSVKVYWQSLQVFKFNLRKYQKLKEIFDSFAKKENVSTDKLLFMYNDRILNCDDTPDSIDYNIAKFIEGGIVSNSVSTLINEKPLSNETINTGIKIKFQCQNTKKPLKIIVNANEKLSLAMTKCAESLEVPLNKLKFEFDGDSIAGTSTPEQIGLENGDCIDVIMLSN